MPKYDTNTTAGAEALLSRYGITPTQEMPVAEPADVPLPDQASPATPIQSHWERENAEDDRGTKLSVIVSADLDSALENAILNLRRSTGVRLKKSHVLRDGIKTFVYGYDLMCANGHRFLIPPQDGISENAQYHCPICGQAVLK